MRRALAPAFAVLAVALLCVPTAGAWAASFAGAPADASLRDSILLAGALRATGTEGQFGAPVADRLSFDAPVTIRYCPDQNGRPQPDGNCPGAEITNGARLYVWAGGLVAQAPGANLTIDAPATAAALSGLNVTLNELLLDPGIYVGGNATVDVEGASLALRPLDRTASIEVRGDEGFRTYNGTAYTLYISGFSRASLEAHGAFVAAADLDVRVTRAGLVPAERELRVVDLYTMLYAIQPAEKADRRAAIPGAFGPFQLVPALLDGALAKRENLTLNDDLRGDFTFLRLTDARLSHDGENWTGSGNASYMVAAQRVTQRPDDSAKWPLYVWIFVTAGAIIARFLTHREPPPKRQRLYAHLVRLAGLGLLSLLATTTLAPLLGFSPLLDAPDLALRSRTQLALLVFGIVLTAFIAIGIPGESLARSAFSKKGRPKETVLAALAGVLAAAIYILFATPLLLTFVARFVRL